MKRFLHLSIFVAFLLNIQAVFAQEKLPADWRKLHYLSAEEMATPANNNVNFTETDPPENPRMVAEFEPMQSVLIRYPLGIPYSLIVEMAENINVVTLVSSTSQANQVLSLYTQNGVNTDNCSFIVAPSDSHWTRDYGPWFVFDGNKQPGIVDFPYDRPRPNDNNVPVAVAQDLGINLYGMNLEHTGGNMMVDGRGMAASTDLVYDENNMTPQQVADKVESYLGITRYDVTMDPLDDYIKHIDCWGKYLAPDKILIGQVPESDYRYDDYEAVANYFATTPCAYGYPYKVYRVFTPGGNPTTPYTNSTILNNKVLLPLSGSQYDDEAMAVYEEAMPGYEIVGITWNSWYNTDALHCRTRGIADLEMLFIDHRPLYGTVSFEDSLAVSSKIIAYSGEDLVADSLLVYYSINGAAYQTTTFAASADEDEFIAYIKGYDSGDTIDYYVFAKDETGRRLMQPYAGAFDPHQFVVEEQQIMELTVMPDTLYYINEIEDYLVLKNETANPITVQEIGFDDVWWFEFYELPDLPFVIEPDESVEIMVIVGLAVQMAPNNYMYANIEITTDIGDYKVPVKINMDLVSDISETKILEAQVYPNPFDQQLNIKLNLPQAEKLQIVLTDLSGRIVEFISAETFEAGEHQIQLAGKLAKGVYFLKISDGKQQQITKLIKQ